jgi:dihydrofolate reductase
VSGAAESLARPRLTLIAAVARNGVIGADNGLLWHLPEDLRHFRAITSGHAVIMGRKTWDSLPARFRPLPGRRNIVVTRDNHWSAPGAEAVRTPAAALALLGSGAPAFVIGGAELYAAMLPWADELLLTEIDADFAGDAHFPAWDRGRFDEVSREPHHAAAPNAFDYAFVSYRRVARRAE